MRQLRQIKVKFLGPTNNKGARIKIYEPKRYHDDKVQSKIFPYCYATGDLLKQGLKILEENNFLIKGYVGEIDNYIILCDNWGEKYLEIKNIKK